jgi:predicted CopG family antitoxin
MGRRTQITLDEDQYARLRALSGTTGLSMSELIRRALDRTYARRGIEALDATFGMWRDRDDLDDMMERLRPGLGNRRKARGSSR